MNRWMMRIVVLVISASTFIGCSSKESRVPGKWVEQGTKDTSNYVEFFSDKTVTMQTPQMPLSGKWTILSDGRIKADMDVMWSSMTIMGELNGKRLILDIDGHKSTFVKM